MNIKNPALRAIRQMVGLVGTVEDKYEPSRWVVRIARIRLQDLGNPVVVTSDHKPRVGDIVVQGRDRYYHVFRVADDAAWRQILELRVNGGEG